MKRSLIDDCAAKLTVGLSDETIFRMFCEYEALHPYNENFSYYFKKPLSENPRRAMREIIHKIFHDRIAAMLDDGMEPEEVEKLFMIIPEKPSQ